MEQIEPRSKKVRGLAKATLEMIEQGQLICEQCAPISVRGIAYKLLPLGFFDSMKQVGKVSRVMVKARQRGFISWGDIFDETRELEREAS